MPIASCPECEDDVYVAAETEQSTIISCNECGVDLEVVGMDPIQLDPYFVKNLDDYDYGFNIYDNDDDYSIT